MCQRLTYHYRIGPRSASPLTRHSVICHNPSPYPSNSLASNPLAFSPLTNRSILPRISYHFVQTRHAIHDAQVTRLPQGHHAMGQRVGADIRSTRTGHA